MKHFIGKTVFLTGWLYGIADILTCGPITYTVTGWILDKLEKRKNV